MTRPVEIRGEVQPRDSHAHPVAEALSERPCGRLNAFDEQVLGVARRLTAPLPEILDVVEGQAVSGQMEEAVEEHAAVACREYEAVTVRPAGLSRMVLQEAVPQDVSHGGGSHGKSRVSRVRLLDGVHRKASYGVHA